MALKDLGNVQKLGGERLDQICYGWQRTSCHRRQLNFLESKLSLTLFVQGKGYPDLATRRFIRACLDCDCWTYVQEPKVFGFFDCDRDGIAIMQIYRQGSIALAHEQSSTIPEMKWLGMKLDDVVSGTMTEEPLLPLTLIDRERIRAMLARQSSDADLVQQQVLSELQKMLVLDVKAEMQLLDDRPGGLVQWLEERIWRELVPAAW